MKKSADGKTSVYIGFEYPIKNDQVDFLIYNAFLNVLVIYRLIYSHSYIVAVFLQYFKLFECGMVRFCADYYIYYVR